MSELKVIKSYVTTFDDYHNDMLLVSHTKENYASAKQIECYLKSEADKVIAELKAQIAQLEDDCAFWKMKKSEDDKVIAEKDAKILALDAEVFKEKHHAKLFFDERNYAETQLHHHKYMRALDKAKICQLSIERYGRYIAEFKDCGYPSIQRWRFLKNHYEKWYQRWLELTEKLKEAK